MRVISVIFISALAAVFCGCTPAVSVRPLYTEADLKHPIIEPHIEGEWVRFDEENGDGDKWKIAHGFNDTYDIEFRPAKPDPQKGEEVSKYSIRLVSIGDKLFFDGQFVEWVEGQISDGGDYPGLAPAHIIGGIWVHPDYLRMAFLDSEWIEKHSPASFQESVGHGQGEDLAIITASTQEVRDFLVRAQDEEGAIFSIYLCRAGVDCPMRWAEDELSRLPKDEDRRDEILKQASLVFLAGEITTDPFSYNAAGWSPSPKTLRSGKTLPGHFSSIRIFEPPAANLRRYRNRRSRNPRQRLRTGIGIAWRALPPTLPRARYGAISSRATSLARSPPWRITKAATDFFP